MAPYILAIDQGTTSTRSILFRPDLSVAAFGQQEFAQHFPTSGWVEHEPEDLWRTLIGIFYSQGTGDWQPTALRMVDVFVNGLRRM